QAVRSGRADESDRILSAAPPAPWEGQEMRPRSWPAIATLPALLVLAACGLSGAPSLPDRTAADASAGLTATSLPGGVWRLATLRPAGQTEVTIANPDLFTAEFTAQGRVSLRADCNRCAGGYRAGRTSLTVGPMACTRAYCVATAPLDSTFEALVSGAETWSAPDEQHLEVASAAGRLRFQR